MRNYFLSISMTAIVFTSISAISSEKSWGNSSETYLKNSNYLTNNHNHSRTFWVAHEKENPLAVPENQAVPNVVLVIHPDEKKGWNLELKVSNFKFAPEHINQEASFTEGHAHLYINDQKITRIYGNWYYLSSLEKGRNKITVTLSSNNHQVLTYQGKVIQDTQLVEVE